MNNECKVKVTRTTGKDVVLYAIGDGDATSTTVTISLPHGIDVEDSLMLRAVMNQRFLSDMMHNLSIIDIEKEINR